MYLLFYTLFSQDDVDSYMANEDNSNVQQVLKKLDEQHSKYRFMETNLLAKKRRFDKIFFNFITVRCYCLFVGWRCKFRIWNSLWAWSSCYKSRRIKAISKIWSLNSVSRSKFTWKQRFLRLTKSAFGLEWVNILNKYTWITYFALQANVMLEYTLDGATELLTKNTQAAKRNLGYIEHDLNFLRQVYY